MMREASDVMIEQQKSVSVEWRLLVESLNPVDPVQIQIDFSTLSMILVVHNGEDLKK